MFPYGIQEQKPLPLLLYVTIKLKALRLRNTVRQPGEFYEIENENISIQYSSSLF